MLIIFSLWSTAPYIDVPTTLVAWLGWLFALFCIGWGIKTLWRPAREQSMSWWVKIAIFGLVTPLTTSLLGLGFPSASNLNIPEMPIDMGVPSVMIFSAIPWVLAAGLSGPIPAVVLALLAGITRAMGETHSLFTIVEMGMLGLIFAWCVNQPYRSRLFVILRQPMGAFVLTSLSYIPMIMLLSLVSTNGSLAVRLDYALTQTYPLMITRSTELFLAVIPAALIKLWQPAWWVRFAKLKPSPIETSLTARFYYFSIPMILAVILALMVGDWLVAGYTARQLLQEKLASTAMIATENMPYFLESGQNLIRRQAERPINPAEPNIDQQLEARAREVPFFQQLLLVDLSGQRLGSFPSDLGSKARLTQDERNAILLASKGVMVQTYAIPAAGGSNTARIVFIAPVRNENQQIETILLGYADLNNNPYTQAAIQALMNSATDNEGRAYILDENRRILFASDTSQVMTPYGGPLPELDGSFLDNTSTLGTRQFVYYARVSGPPWSVVISVPATRTQDMALTTAMPLLILLVILLISLMTVWQLLLRFMTDSLQSLAQEASLISQGKLDHPMQILGADEVGQLGNAFDGMRLSLKARLDELSHLLAVSEGVASNLAAEDAVKPILEAAMRNGAALARVVLLREVALNAGSQRVVSFGMGRSSELYAYLDEQIFDLMTGQDILTIPSTVRMRRLTFLNEM
ncbi:MAG: cache and HAMP domain-containing protein, partial [Anaerolineae bacterium]|nr:cache and HAMP domain-containing protein [Anaerolineae bacterium]